MADSPSQASSAGSARARSPLDDFTGAVYRPSMSVFYQLGLIFVAIGMALLPVIYLGLVALATYGVYYHATHNFSRIMGGVGGHSSRVMLFKLVLYAGPIFAGSVLVFFMFKPLFAKRGPQPQPYALNPDSEPLLFAFIHKICALVGAPAPERIDLNCELNASAGFRRGVRSLFANDLVLTIGMPLVGGLTMREFAGVMAHEFGHFTQGVGMRLTYIIRRINFWFARVVYERDQWDLALDTWAAEVEDGWVSIVVAMARLGVWTSRRILELLMIMGHFISGFMLRQMEYDADHYEIQLAGSEAFESTMRRMACLSAASELASREMRAAWTSTKRLPDNFPVFLLQKAAEMPPEAMRKVEDRIGLAKTGWLSTHPSDADRIRCARMANKPGIFHRDDPAYLLFEKFEIPARFTTLMFYREDLGLELPDSALVETAPLARPDTTTPEELEALLDQFYFGAVGTLDRLTPEPGELAVPAEAFAKLAEARTLAAQIESVAPSIRQACEAAEVAEAERLKAFQALRLLDAGYPLDPPATPESLRQHFDGATERKRQFQHQLAQVESAIRTRLQCAFDALLVPEIADRIGAQPVEAAMQYLRVASLFGAAQAPLESLKFNAEALALLSSQEASSRSGTETLKLRREIDQAIEALGGLFASSAGKLEADKGGAEVDGIVRPGGQVRTAEDSLQRASDVLEHFEKLRRQTLSRIARAASQAEALLPADNL